MKDLSNENVIHVKRNNIEYLQFKKLLEYDNIIKHCFTLKPLDFGNNSTYEMSKEKITNDYKKICNELDLDYKKIVRPYQTHTSNLKNVKDKTGIFIKEYENVDGLITNKKDRILSLTYADCTPIYLFDANKKVIGNIHSGWLGTTKKIGQKAVYKMIDEYNINPKDIICIIGPTIRKCHFEVDEDVKEIFKNSFSNLKNINDVIIESRIIDGKQKYFIDTVKINIQMVLEAGLKEENIIDSNICTVCNSDLIYSYRGNNKIMGRNTSLICLK